MRLCRFGLRGHEKPGLIDSEGKIRDLSSVVADITPATLSTIRSVNIESLPVVEGPQRFGIPLNGIGTIIAIGLNYADHAVESNLPIPREPIMFMKAVSSLNGPFDEVMLPKGAVHADWEVELGAVIGTTCRSIDEEKALERVAGYVLVNDISERFNQKQRGNQWSKGKGHDTFCPVGPWLVTPDEIGDPQSLDMQLDVNRVRMQTGNTKTMIFNVRQLIAYVSNYITLYPGEPFNYRYAVRC